MLTKTRFRLAFECPTKVHYSLDKRYVDARAGDEFLEALADGGHQVGKLAQLLALRDDPGAVEIDARDADDQVRHTEDLLRRDNVTLFEATFRHDRLLIRADIVRKRGRRLELVEVKAKSWDPSEDSLIGVGPRANPIDPDWEPYVYDLALQHHVVRLAHPGLDVVPLLCLVDKSATNTTASLGARFRVEREGRRAVVDVAPEFRVEDLDQPLLVEVDATKAVLRAQTLVRTRRGRPALEFHSLIDELTTSITSGVRIDPRPSTVCKKCEFDAPPASRTDATRSGWAECMQFHFRRPVLRARSESVFGLHGQANLSPLLVAQHLWLDECDPDDLGTWRAGTSLSGKSRQRLQVLEISECVATPQLALDTLRAAARTWTFPLHFVDFETAMPALPFFVGHRPYQQILFQFSHHVRERDGATRHATECLISRRDTPPSIDVVRELRNAVGDTGTIFHWYPHERTVLRAVAKEIDSTNPPDRDNLLEFLNSLGLEKDSAGRCFDLGRLFEDAVFLPGTGGSSSMKKVLPAVLRLSAALRARYAAPIYGTRAWPSRNFSEKTWVIERDGAPVDPYQLLDPLLSDAELSAELASLEEEDASFVANGGAAMIAYATLQRPDLPDADRVRLEAQLRRYCELDTLAMVLALEAILDWVGPDLLPA